jgi:hypothetical protein
MRPTRTTFPYSKQDIIFLLPCNYVLARTHTEHRLRELNLEYLLRELNKLFPNTTFCSDFSTQFDYHSTITQGITSGSPAPEAKEYNRRVKTSMFNTFVASKPEPEATPGPVQKELVSNPYNNFKWRFTVGE